MIAIPEKEHTPTRPEKGEIIKFWWEPHTEEETRFIYEDLSAQLLICAEQIAEKAVNLEKGSAIREQLAMALAENMIRRQAHKAKIKAVTA